MKISHQTSALIALILLGGYLFLSIFSLMHMGHMSMHDMTMKDCPYLPLKPLSGDDMAAHLKGWHDFTSIVLPFLSLILVSFCIQLFSSSLLVIQFFKPKRIGFDPPPLWEQLLSQGILHPKVP